MVITLEDLIKQNERKIERFDSKYYLNKKNYAMAAAISALETTNEIQKSYFKMENNLTSSDYILRLYALLQGLFVSIDALYAMAILLTKSKNFININNNKDLRQLKYIRNDVVGHPSNRKIHQEDIAFCILDNSSITLDSFSYHIYTKDGVTKKDISIKEILLSYYKESNELLDELYKLASKNKNKTELEFAISKVLDDYFFDKDYLASFERFYKVYLEFYPSAKKEQHRILWRYDLIVKLQEIKSNNQEEMDIYHYCIGLELIKIYELIFQTKYKVDLLKSTPKYIGQFYRFLNKNKSLYPYLDYIKDSDHPMFLNAIEQLKIEAFKNKLPCIMHYLDMIIAAFKENNLDFVYALALPIKEYKRK